MPPGNGEVGINLWVEENGTLTSSPKYDVYGLVRSNPGTASSRQGSIGSLGYISDAETGLIYMRARYYDPSMERFISQDSNQDGHNWFVCCNDDPVNLVDKVGKSRTPSQIFWATLAAVFGFLATVFGALTIIAEAASIEVAVIAVFDLGLAMSLVAGAAFVTVGPMVLFGVVVLLAAMAAICAVLAVFDDAGGINSLFPEGDKSENAPAKPE